MLTNFLYPVLDVLTWPLRLLPEVASLTVLSLLIGVLVMKVYEYTSDQWAMAYHKDRLGAYQHELLSGRYTLSVFKGLAYHNAKLGVCGLVPAITCITALLIVIPWVGNRAGHHPAATMTPVEVQVEASSGWTLDTSDQELRIDQARNDEISPQILAETAGEFSLTVRAKGHSTTVPLSVGDRYTTVWPTITKSQWYHYFANPAERTIPSKSPVKSIRIDYPGVLSWMRLSIPYMGQLPGWLVWFFTASFLSGLYVKQRWGIE